MSNLQSIDTDQIAEVFKVLGNPHRLQILSRLANCCPAGSVCDPDREKLFVGEVSSDLSIVPSTVSHHIKELVRVGLVRTSRDGKNVACCLNPSVLMDLEAFLKRLTGK